jgi:hypothetical protein
MDLTHCLRDTAMSAQCHARVGDRECGKFLLVVYSVIRHLIVCVQVGTPLHSRIKMPITPERTPPRPRPIPHKPKARKSGDTSRMAPADETPIRRVTRSMAALRVAST